MSPEHLSSFVDPDTGAPLTPRDLVIEGGHVKSGTLVSPTGAAHEIRDFVPRFVPAENYASNFGLQWQLHRKTQLDSYNGASYSRDRLFGTTGWPREMRGERILEAGSGAGRFTEVLVNTRAEVFSFDFSQAVVANYANNGHSPNLRLFQGDIYRIPLPKKSFDRVICIGVLQHTPDVRKTFASLAAMVKPGGTLMVDAYSSTWKQVLHWKYVVRPFTRKMDPQRLYHFVNWYAPKLMPLAKLARKIGGKAGARLVPILDQSDKSVPPHVQRDWTILDTYDALSPAYDSPQSSTTLRKWFEEEGFRDIWSSPPQDSWAIGRGIAP
jgi:ubiquinone/menaquinone biosynthesis C-methylase UbiE